MHSSREARTRACVLPATVNVTGLCRGHRLFAHARLWLRCPLAFASISLGRVSAPAVGVLLLVACHLVLLLLLACQLHRVRVLQGWLLLWVASAAAAAVGGVLLAASGAVFCSSAAPPPLSPCCAALLPPRTRQLFRSCVYEVQTLLHCPGSRRRSVLTFLLRAAAPACCHRPALPHLSAPQVLLNW